MSTNIAVVSKQNPPRSTGASSRHGNMLKRVEEVHEK